MFLLEVDERKGHGNIHSINALQKCGFEEIAFTCFGGEGELELLQAHLYTQ